MPTVVLVPSIYALRLEIFYPIPYHPPHTNYMLVRRIRGRRQSRRKLYLY
jgi:hypothetical protein